MERSPELEFLARKVFRELADGNGQNVAEIFSDRTGTIAIGTAAEEWWDGAESVRAAFSVQAGELPSFTFDMQSVAGWREGPIGWAVARVEMTMAGVDPMTLRTTFVAREEGAYWRVVQWHVSMGVANEDSLGVVLTTDFEDLLEIVKRDDVPALAAATAGPVSIMFTDIEGSTLILDRIGDAAWLDLARWHRALVAEATATSEGQVVQFLGDGFMLAFPDERRAAVAAVAIQRAHDPGWKGEEIRLRIGIESGDTLNEGDNFFGRTVVMAARLAAAACGGQVFASDRVRNAVSPGVEFDAPLSLTLKGFSGAHNAHPLLWKR